MAPQHTHVPLSAQLAQTAMVQLLGQGRRLARFSLSGRHPGGRHSLLRDPDHFTRQHLQPARLDEFPAATGGTSHV
jgi:hypothetical protein